MLQETYKSLFRNYGPQLWWPVTLPGKLHPEYTGGPKNEKQQLEVIYGAILTQNTSWKNVEKTIHELNKRELIDIDKILEIEHSALAGIIKSSGYFNQKAKKLKNAAQFLKGNQVKKLAALDTEALRVKLLSVNGIGPETADSIILYAFDKPIFVIDTYTKRIFSRIGSIHKNPGYDELQELFHKRLEKDSKLYNEYHALIVEHAKRSCNKKPVCEGCVLEKICKKRI